MPYFCFMYQTDMSAVFSAARIAAQSMRAALGHAGVGLLPHVQRANAGSFLTCRPSVRHDHNL
jgi:hypothetical protein